MRLPSFLLVFAFLAFLKPACSLPACSSTSGSPCSCPTGTTNQESATFAVIGATATDVQNLLGSCMWNNLTLSCPEFSKGLKTKYSPNFFPQPVFKTAWFGLLPFATTGTDFEPGATRTYTLPFNIGSYNITEELTLFYSHPSGSFIQKFEQAPFNVPTPYRTHNGSFSGFWGTLKSDAVFHNTTSIVFSTYLCATGHPLST